MPKPKKDPKQVVILLRAVRHEGEHQEPGTQLQVSSEFANRLIHSGKALPFSSKSEQEDAADAVSEAIAAAAHRKETRENRRAPQPVAPSGEVSPEAIEDAVKAALKPVKSAITKLENKLTEQIESLEVRLKEIEEAFEEEPDEIKA